MPTDRWGYKKIYPTKKWAGITSGPTTGLSYEQSSNIMNDGIFNDEGHVKDSSNYKWTFTTSGPDAVQIGRNGTDDSAIGGCGMNFTDTARRGYAYKNTDVRDFELTFAIKFVSGGENGLALEGPTGPHSGSGCCSGFAYKVDIDFGQNPPVFRFRKEMFHVDNSDDPKTGKWTNSKFNFDLKTDRYVGFKYIRYNKKGQVTGHNTTDSVVLELWGNIHPDTQPLDWFLMKRTEDKGGWGDSGDECDGDKDQIGSWSAEKIRIKSNDPDGEYDFKNLSWREIDPTLTFEDIPDGGSTDNPPSQPSEVTGILSLKYDINVYRIGACSPAGSIEFYSSGKDPVDDTSSWIYTIESSTGVTRTRIGLHALNSLSKLCNQPPLQEADFYLWKSGSPTGTLTVRIRNSNMTVKATMGTLDVSTLSTSPVLKPFINLSNGYKMVAGDYLLAEYSGGDSSNYVRIAKRNTLTATDGINTKSGYWNTFPSTDRWEEFTTREISGKLWN
jgi:hypothetical protein